MTADATSRPQIISSPTTNISGLRPTNTLDETSPLCPNPSPTLSDISCSLRKAGANSCAAKNAANFMPTSPAFSMHHESPLIEINSGRDHIHILFAQSKNHAPAKLLSRSKRRHPRGSNDNKLGMPISHGRRVSGSSASVRCTSSRCRNIFASNRSITNRRIFRPSSVGFARRMGSRWMSDMRGIESNPAGQVGFVPRIQGRGDMWCRLPGPSLRFSRGYHIVGFQPERERN